MAAIIRSATADTAILKRLRNIREDLLRQYVRSNSREKADVFSKIMDVEEQIESEVEAMHRVQFKL